ncbi:MAG TPA: calcium-binding protein [Planctomycetaceae bacterium]|nr:calcium-binding protein [Planctomycetaceae bacterium]
MRLGLRSAVFGRRPQVTGSLGRDPGGTGTTDRFFARSCPMTDIHRSSSSGRRRRRPKWAPRSRTALAHRPLRYESLEERKLLSVGSDSELLRLELGDRSPNEYVQTSNFSILSSGNRAGTDASTGTDTPGHNPLQVVLPGAGRYVLRRDGQQIALQDEDGQVVAQWSAEGRRNVVILGSLGDDTLIIDYSGGDPLPGRRLGFDGAGHTDGDRLELTGHAVQEVRYKFTGQDRAFIDVNGGTIVYRGVERIRDQLIAAHRIFRFGSGDDVITLTDDPLANKGMCSISGSSRGERVDFANPTDSLAIHAGRGDDTVTLAAVDAAFEASLVVDGYTGDDRLDARSFSLPVTLIGSTGNDTLTGGSSDDELFGHAGQDLLDGGKGDDRLHGQGGDDQILGGEGDDHLYGGSGDDRLDGGSGVDRLYGHAGNDTLVGAGGRDYLRAHAGDDRLDGGEDVDRLFGFRGNDVLRGGPGNDFLCGLEDSDELFGGPGNDKLRGGSGRDLLDGGAGNDFLKGDGHDDRLYGRRGHDLLYGGAGNDLLWGGEHDDRLFGGPGNDVLVGQAGRDQLFGNSQRDLIIGGRGADQLHGVSGEDILIAGATSYDDQDAALLAILSEWDSDRDYQARTKSIRDGSGSVLQGVALQSGVSVFDDQARDVLDGGAELDWFFALTDGQNGDADDVAAGPPEQIERL